MNQYVDVQEFSELTGKTDVYIRRLCNHNKLPNYREKLPNSSNTKFMIDTTSSEAQKMINKHAQEKINVSEPVTEQNKKNNDTDETILDLVEQIKELSEIKGKYEQIEDLRERDKESAATWEKRYFDIQDQVTQLNKQVSEQKANNIILTEYVKQLKDQLKQVSEQLETERNKKFLGLFKI